MGVLSSKTDPRWVSITLCPVPLHSSNIHEMKGFGVVSGQFLNWIKQGTFDTLLVFPYHYAQD